MVDNSIIQHLVYSGLTEYEARAYVALLQNSPMTAYETAMSAGISTSKIYEVLSRLEGRSVVVAVEEGGKKKYIPQDPAEFVSVRRFEINNTVGFLERALPKVRAGGAASHMLGVLDYEGMVGKARAMIDSSRDTLLLSLWPQELEVLSLGLRLALKRGVRVAMVHFGLPQERIGQVYPHPIDSVIYEEKKGRTLVVVADSSEALMATVAEGGGVDGASSKSGGFVTLADDFIRHDIYMMKVVRRFDRLLRESFGDEYEKLRNVFEDEENENLY